MFIFVNAPKHTHTPQTPTRTELAHSWILYFILFFDRSVFFSFSCGHPSAAWCAVGREESRMRILSFYLFHHRRVKITASAARVQLLL